MNDTHPFFARRLSRNQLVMLDVMAGMGFAFVFITVAVHATELPPWARAALALGLGLPLAVRRLWPLTIFCLTLVLAVYAVVVDAVGFAYVAPAYVLYTVALSDKLGPAVPTTAIGVVTLTTVVGLAAMGTPRDSAPEWMLHLDKPLLGIAALGGAWTVGRAVRERRLFAARDAERLAAQAVTDERLRIARELHDVVTHSVGLIAVQAGVANHVMASKPDAAHNALRVIETASRSALVEMRHLLGVLRSTSAPDLVPVPGVAGIQGLVEQARLAGVETELDVRIGPGGDEGQRPGGSAAGEPLTTAGDRACGEMGLPGGLASRGLGLSGVKESAGRQSPETEASEAGREDGPDAGEPDSPNAGRPDALRSGGDWAIDGRGASRGLVGELRLPDGVGLSVYRIVQEALTNVVKHAGPARCRVSLAVDDKEARIEVVDDGLGKRGPASGGAGHGLIGMRERVMMYGGVFEAGKLPGRGFRIFAKLPYEEVA